ncbi:hypothetical protein OH77DRAFT_1587960 [Trametes cingulata]|nr:hypothetical protein OH77DRAFT_1587960 [Trametes cingulata]
MSQSSQPQRPSSRSPSPGAKTPALLAAVQVAVSSAGAAALTGPGVPGRALSYAEVASGPTAQAEQGPSTYATKNPEYDPGWGATMRGFPDGAPINLPLGATADAVQAGYDDLDGEGRPRATPTPPASPHPGLRLWPDDLVIEGTSTTPSPVLEELIGEHCADGGSLLDLITDGIGPNGFPLPGRIPDYSARRQKRPRSNSDSWASPPRPAPGRRSRVIFGRAEERSPIGLLPPPSPVLRPTEPPPVWLPHFAYASPHPPPVIHSAREELAAQRALFDEETDELVADYEAGRLEPPPDDEPEIVPVVAPGAANTDVMPEDDEDDMTMDVDLPPLSTRSLHASIHAPAEAVHAPQPVRPPQTAGSVRLPTRKGNHLLPNVPVRPNAASTPAPSSLRPASHGMLANLRRQMVTSNARPPVRTPTPFPTMFATERSPTPTPARASSRASTSTTAGGSNRRLPASSIGQPFTNAREEHTTPYTAVMATLTPLAPPAASIRPVFTPPPDGGFSLPVLPDPEELLHGMVRNRVAALWGEPTDSVALIRIWNVGVPRPGQLRPLADALTAAVHSITGDLDPFILSPEQDWAVPIAQRVMPITWTALRLSTDGARRLLQGRVWSAPTITFFAYPRSMPIPRYLFTLGGFQHDRDNDIIGTVWATMTGTQALPHSLRLLQDNPHFVNDTLEEAAEIMFSGLEVTVYRLSNGNINAAVFCDSPTVSVQRWREWRNAMAQLPFASHFNATGFARRPALCEACHGADHPTHRCPFSEIPGWNGPPAGQGPAFPGPGAPSYGVNHAPSQPGSPRPGPSRSRGGNANRASGRRGGWSGRGGRGANEGAPY